MRVYCSTLTLSVIGIRNLCALCLATMVYTREIHSMWSVAISMLVYMADHLIKPGVKCRKSIVISVHSLSGRCTCVTSSSGGFFDCLTRWQASQLTRTIVQDQIKIVIDLYQLDIVLFSQLQHLLSPHMLHQSWVYNSSHLQKHNCSLRSASIA